MVLNFSLFGGFTGLEGNIECQILGRGGGGGAPTPLHLNSSPFIQRKALVQGYKIRQKGAGGGGGGGGDPSPLIEK